MKPFRIMVQALRLACLVAFVMVFATVAHAQTNVTPDLGTSVPGDWVTDRYQPGTFALTGVPTHGRNNVLEVGITASGDALNRPGGQQGTFYNTHGMKIPDVNTAGSWSFGLDLFVESSWSDPNSGYVRSDIWGTATGDAGFTSITAYPILGFSNYGTFVGFRGYDVNTGAWMNFSDAVNFGAWNSLAMAFDMATNTFSYFVNGSLAGSVVGNYATTGVKEVMVQAYNYNDPLLGISTNPEYSAYWSNSVPTETVPEPATMTLLATGLAGIASKGLRRRKKQ